MAEDVTPLYDDVRRTLTLTIVQMRLSAHFGNYVGVISVARKQYGNQQVHPIAKSKHSEVGKSCRTYQNRSGRLAISAPGDLAGETSISDTVATRKH